MDNYAPASTLIKMLPSGLKAMAAMFLRFSKAKVDDLLLENIVRILTDFSDNVNTTHFTKSKTETRLPTGLNRLLPSGVKRIFPCW